MWRHSAKQDITEFVGVHRFNDYLRIASLPYDPIAYTDSPPSITKRSLRIYRFVKSSTFECRNNAKNLTYHIYVYL